MSLRICPRDWNRSKTIARPPSLSSNWIASTDGCLPMHMTTFAASNESQCLIAIERNEGGKGVAQWGRCTPHLVSEQGSSWRIQKYLASHRFLTSRALQYLNMSWLQNGNWKKWSQIALPSSLSLNQTMPTDILWLTCIGLLRNLIVKNTYLHIITNWPVRERINRSQSNFPLRPNTGWSTPR